ncbi:MAG: hypothetical protein C0606_13910 [Hyphomicrobiales bacterium]|nr:MAG: hypothetical protein C0606_13910 [Hyphomicrobiales bacterium]
MGSYLKTISAALAVSLVASVPAAAYSKNAVRLIKEQIKEACDGRSGRMLAEGVFETDLTGNGRTDLIIDHGGIECTGEMTRSGFCGVRACSVLFYVNDGRKLKKVDEALSIGVEVDDESPPNIKTMTHDFREFIIRWDGKAFK